jgi:hypothetical protein
LTNAAQGQYWIGADAASLAPVGSPVNFLGGGLINAGVLTATGTVSVQLRASQTIGGVLHTGMSNVITVTATDAPAPPASLTGLQSFTIQPDAIPEPSTIALGLLGAAALFLRRRK